MWWTWPSTKYYKHSKLNYYTSTKLQTSFAAQCWLVFNSWMVPRWSNIFYSHLLGSLLPILTGETMALVTVRSQQRHLCLLISPLLCAIQILWMIIYSCMGLLNMPPVTDGVWFGFRFAMALIHVAFCSNLSVTSCCCVTCCGWSNFVRYGWKSAIAETFMRLEPA